MQFDVTRHIAIGVSDREAAERFYSEVLGLEIGRREEDWTEVLAGELRLYLCDDDMAFCLSVKVDDPVAAASQMVEAGSERLFESGGEVFVKDPFGGNWCLGSRSQ